MKRKHLKSSRISPLDRPRLALRRSLAKVQRRLRVAVLLRVKCVENAKSKRVLLSMAKSRCCARRARSSRSPRPRQRPRPTVTAMAVTRAIMLALMVTRKILIAVVIIVIITTVIMATAVISTAKRTTRRPMPTSDRSSLVSLCTRQRPTCMRGHRPRRTARANRKRLAN
jgi:hypothetical protein